MAEKTQVKFTDEELKGMDSVDRKQQVMIDALIAQGDRQHTLILAVVFQSALTILVLGGSLLMVLLQIK